MKEGLLEIITCPICKKRSFKIEKIKKNNQEIRSCEITCNYCSAKFEVNKGILNLLPNPKDSIKKEQKGWMKLSDKKSLRKNKENDLKMVDLPWCINFPKDRKHWKDHADNFDFVLEQLNLKGDEKVLDLGAGRCWSTREFARIGCACVALDVVSTRYVGLESADIYLEHNNIFFERVLADMNNLPFVKDSFDIVFSTASIHHSSDLVELFKEASRVLKKNGKIVLINEPVRGIFESKRLCCDEVEQGINEHIYRLVDYEKSAKKAGFKVNVYMPESIRHMLESGEIKGEKKYKKYLGRVVSKAWQQKKISPYIEKMHYLGQHLIGMGLVMIGEKKD